MTQILVPRCAGSLVESQVMGDSALALDGFREALDAVQRGRLVR
ncbi:hypothetical protein ACVHYJ_17340 [Burkholderia pyrrocinia]